ncbi:MAG: PPC domain-containing protein [Pirellulales bacterium]|nr:PPC domain-containing protein [Pirellulales bacterium]
MFMRFSLALIFLLPAAVAAAAAPRLDNLQPQGGQRGTEVAVTLIGGRIGQDPQEVMFYDPGISVKGIERIDDNQMKVVLAIAADCQPGIHGLRVRTATGVTNLRTFHVGTLPEIVEKEPNNAFESPQPIDLGAVVNGVVTNEDVDYFVVDAKQGERISVEVEGLRLGRTFFDPAVTIFDEKRFEVASADDSPLLQQDAYCTVLAPKDGKYLIELRETSYRGDDASTYRLHVGKFSRPAGAFPGGGVPGQPLEVKWLGDPAGEKSETVTLPSPAPLGYRISASDENGAAPTGVPLRAVDLPNVIEAEPNKELDQATRGEVPGAFCGIIGEAEDWDRFRFAAKKGEVFDFNLVAREIRSPLDGVLRLRNAKGDVLAAADDNGGKPDAYFRYTFPEDGEYVVEVEDHLRQGQPTYLYRVEISRPQAAVDLVLEERQQYEATEIVVPQGNRMAIMITANRADVGGDLNVGLGELPAGVTQEVNPLAADYNRVPVLLRAAADAPLAGKLTTVTAELVDKSQPLVSRFKQQTWLIRGSNNVPVWNHWTERAAVAVAQPAPFTVSIVAPQAPLVQSGAKGLKVVAEKRDGFDGRIAVRLLFDPPGLSSHQGIGIEPGQTEAVIPMTTAGNAWARDWKIIVVAEADVNGPVRTSTEFATLKLVPPYLAMTFPPVATEQGKPIDYPIAIQQTTPFEGPATVELVGLPPGVTTSPQEITKDSTEVKFPLAVAADARVGHHRQLYCQVTITQNGEPVVHTIGTGELRIDEPLPPAQTAQQPPPSGGESS